jgi:hypothetical protein
MLQRPRVPREDRSSPNGVLATIAVALFVFALLGGKDLWIPASRIPNLSVRAIALAMTDAVSSFAADVGLDAYVPALRDTFVATTGLSGHPEWDTRYFNRRSPAQEIPAITGVEGEGGASVAGTSAADTSAAGVTQGSPFAMIGQGIAIPAVEANPSSGLQAAVPVPRLAKASVVHNPENPLRVFFFGDSQVFSLGSGLSRMAGKNAGFSIDILAIHSSGFIRSDYYDWPAKLQDTFNTVPYEAAVMMLGMNDHQSFRDAGDVILKKESPEWEAAYKEKCRQMIDLVLASVPRLYWIGMPVVKNGEYEKGLEYINRIQDEVASEYSSDLVARISLRDTIPGTGKAYTDSVNLAGGKPLRVMSGDGAHFTVEGGQLAMRPLFDRLCADYPFSAKPVANLPE